MYQYINGRWYETDFGRYLIDCWEYSVCTDPDRREFLGRRILRYKKQIAESVIKVNPDGSCNKSITSL